MRRADSVRGSPRPKATHDERPRGRFEAFLDGFSLHCGVHLHENDRAGIERLCRYGARGPLTLGRLSKDDDGRYRYRMKRAVRGKDELVLTGLELVEKLAVLIPPPRIHLVRFHGVFAPSATLRAQVVPARIAAASTQVSVDEDNIALPTVSDATYRLKWALLIRRVFAVDILACRRCQGRMRVLAVIEEPEVVTKILEHLGLPSVPIDTAPARAPPQPAFAFDVA